MIASLYPALEDFAIRFERVLDAALQPVENQSGNANAAPDRLVEAMRYGVLDGGKRIRPFLVAQSCALFSIDEELSYIGGVPLELIHCYSLVHDDLPAMDDDDLRRGRPTAHKAYDEATAILVGDALLTEAFEILATAHPGVSAEIQLRLVRMLGEAAGRNGMVGGQMRDLMAEATTLNRSEIEQLQAMKTGALIRFAVEAGGVLGSAQDAEMSALSDFGAAAGLAFQVRDDLLDIESDPQTLGKATGKDADKGKATLVHLLGVRDCRALLDDLDSRVVDIVSIFEGREQGLLKTYRYITAREK